MAIGFHFVDEVVHAWDLAKSIGAPVEFDDEVLETALSISARRQVRGPWFTQTRTCRLLRAAGSRASPGRSR